MSKLYIDTGGTYIRSELYTKGEIFKEKVLTKNNNLIDYIDNFLKKDHKIEQINISFAGQVKDGRIISSPNIKIREKNIRDYYLKKYNIPLKIENDLKCAILAEHNKIKEKDMALLFVGSGVGSAVILDNKIIRGKDNTACEVGHIPFKKAPIPCGCGKYNCIEIFSSGSGLKKWFDYYNLNFKKLKELKESKDERYKNIYQNFIEGILRASATIITLFNPKLLIIGGGVAKSNPYILDIIKRDIKEYALPKSVEGIEIELTQFENASMQGAKLL